MPTPEQLEAIYEADPDMAPYWRFLANTGLRLGEFSVLPVANVDTVDKDPKARVRVVHDPDAGLKVKGQRSVLGPKAAQSRSTSKHGLLGTRFWLTTMAGASSSPSCTVTLGI